MPVMGVTKFQRFFRAAADLNVDKDDLKRFDDFIHQKIYDLMIRAEAAATANGRDVIEAWDLPITKGLQERIHEYRRLDDELQLELEPILERLAERPALDLTVGEETERRLPQVAGGVTVALGHTLKIIEPKLVNPQTAHWERATRVFDELL